MQRHIGRRLGIGATVLAGLFVIVASTWAEEPSEVTTAEDTGPVQLSLEKIALEEQRHKSLKERKDSPISKVIISREDIVQFRDRRAGDLLRRLPGVFVGGPPGEHRDVRLRGLDKEYNQILINGERVSGGGEKREFELDRIPVDMIERIEIVKNPSAEYSSDAVTGIVNIVLRQAPSKLTVDGLIGAGGPADGRGTDKYVGDRNAVLNLGNRSGNIGWRLGGSFFDQIRTKDKTKLKTNKDREVEDEYIPTESLDGFAELSWQASPRDKLRVTPFFLYRQEDKTRTKDTIKFAGATDDTETEREFLVRREPRFTAAWDHQFADGGTLELNGTLNLHEEEKFKTKNTGTKAKSTGALTPKTRETEKEIKRDTETILNLNYRQPFSLWESKHRFSAGTKVRLRDRTKDKTKLTTTLSTGVTANTTGPRDNYAIDERIIGIFAMDEISLFGATITPGVRTELTDAETKDGKTSQVTKTALTNDLTPSAHLAYRLFEQTNLRLSFAKAIRRPKFDDMIPSLEETATQFKLGNPALRPEKSYNYEAQVEHFWKDGVFSVGGYFRDIRDKHEEVIVGKIGLKDVLQVSNVGRGTLWGMETEFMRQLDFEGFHLLKDFRFRSNWTYTISSAVKDPTTGASRQFKDTPRHIINLILEYQHPGTGIGMNVGVNHLTERIDPKTDGTTKVEDALTQLDLSVTKTLGKNLSLFFDTRNLLYAGKNKTDKGEVETESIPTRFFFGLKWFY